MQPPLLFEQVWHAIGNKAYRLKRKKVEKRQGRSFWKQNMAWDAPNAHIGFIIYICAITSVAFCIAYGLPALGVIEYSASDAQIKSAYQEVLNRQPDPQGMETYKNSGWGYEHIKEDLAKSAEKQSLDTSKNAQ